jgi:hypothetical protein
MTDETENSFPDVEELRLKRHATLSTALPYPKLDWSDRGSDKENLKRLRDYCESLANSTLDWYVNHHRPKKQRAQRLHYVVYILVALAGIAPLIKIVVGGVLTDPISDFINSHAGEIALGFIGVAGAIKLWDTNGGYTVDWMRFITTAAQISQELTKFQFNWDKLELRRRRQEERDAAANSDAEKKPDGPAEGIKPAPGGRQPQFEICSSCGSCHPIDNLDPTDSQIKLADEFCEKIFNIVSAEISVWADELKKRVDRMASHHSVPDK